MYATWGNFTWGSSIYGGLRHITDRSEENVTRAKALRKKINASGWTGLSSAEQAEWLSGMKGAYSCCDLNRVGEAVSYLAALLNGYGYAIAVSPKTDWVREDLPDVSDMKDYLSQIATVKARYHGTIELPDDMAGLTIAQANSIELLLYEIEQYIARMVAGFNNCGTYCSGQGVILP